MEKLDKRDETQDARLQALKDKVAQNSKVLFEIRKNDDLFFRAEEHQDQRISIWVHAGYRGWIHQYEGHPKMSSILVEEVKCLRKAFQDAEEGQYSSKGSLKWMLEELSKRINQQLTLEL